jgi:hypothetical protein
MSPEDKTAHIGKKTVGQSPGDFILCRKVIQLLKINVGTLYIRPVFA